MGLVRLCNDSLDVWAVNELHLGLAKRFGVGFRTLEQWFRRVGF